VGVSESISNIIIPRAESNLWVMSPLFFMFCYMWYYLRTVSMKLERHGRGEAGVRHGKCELAFMLKKLSEWSHFHKAMQYKTCVESASCKSSQKGGEN
jgi:hypothetical protein